MTTPSSTAAPASPERTGSSAPLSSMTVRPQATAPRRRRRRPARARRRRGPSRRRTSTPLVSTRWPAITSTAGTRGGTAAAVDLDQQLTDGERSGDARIGEAELRDGGRGRGRRPPPGGPPGRAERRALRRTRSRWRAPCRRPRGRRGRAAGDARGGGQDRAALRPRGPRAVTAPTTSPSPVAIVPAGGPGAAGRRRSSGRRRAAAGRRRALRAAACGGLGRARAVALVRASRDTVPPSVFGHEPDVDRRACRSACVTSDHTGALPSGERST